MLFSGIFYIFFPIY